MYPTSHELWLHWQLLRKRKISLKHDLWDDAKKQPCCRQTDSNLISLNSHCALSANHISLWIHLPSINHHHASTAQWLLKQCTSALMPDNSCPLSSLCQLFHPQHNKGFTESESKFKTDDTVTCYIPWILFHFHWPTSSENQCVMCQCHHSTEVMKDPITMLMVTETCGRSSSTHQP